MILLLVEVLLLKVLSILQQIDWLMRLILVLLLLLSGEQNSSSGTPRKSA